MITQDQNLNHLELQQIQNSKRLFIQADDLQNKKAKRIQNNLLNETFSNSGNTLNNKKKQSSQVFQDEDHFDESESDKDQSYLGQQNLLNNNFNLQFAIRDIDQNKKIIIPQQNKSHTIWIFYMSKRLSNENYTKLKQIYFYNSKSSQNKKISLDNIFSQQQEELTTILPLFNNLTEVTNLIKNFGPSNKYKIVLDYYNAQTALEQIKEKYVKDVEQVHIFNNLKQDGLDILLPIKKKYAKTFSTGIQIYNQISSIIYKAEKQLNFLIHLAKITINEVEKFHIFKKNQVNLFSILPFFNKKLHTYVSISMNQKKKYVQSYLKYLKETYSEHQSQKQLIRMYQKLNHISPISTVQKATELLKIFLNFVQKNDQQQNGYQQKNKSPYGFLFRSIVKKIKMRQSFADQIIGLYEIFHSIRIIYNKNRKLLQEASIQQVQKKLQVIRQVQQSLEKSQFINQSQNIQKQNANKSNLIFSQQYPQHEEHQQNEKVFFKIYNFQSIKTGQTEINNQISNIFQNNYLQVNQFLQVYTNYQKASNNFYQTYSQDKKNIQIKDKVLFVIHVKKKSNRNSQTSLFNTTTYTTNSNHNAYKKEKQLEKNYIDLELDYGFIEFDQFFQDNQIDLNQEQRLVHLKQVVLFNILNTFKVTKIQHIKSNNFNKQQKQQTDGNMFQKYKNEGLISIVHLEHNPLIDIFQQDPNYISLSLTKIFEIYKTSPLFKDLNPNFLLRQEQRLRRLNKRNKRYFRNKNTTAQNQKPKKMNSLSNSSNSNIDSKSNKINSKIMKINTIFNNENQIIDKSLKFLDIEKDNQPNDCNEQDSLIAFQNYLKQLQEQYDALSDQLKSLKQKLSTSEKKAKVPNSAILLKIYKTQFRMYEIQFENQNYHTSLLHVKNLQELVLNSNYFFEKKWLKLSEISNIKAEIHFKAGNLNQCLKQVQNSMNYIQNKFVLIEDKKTWAKVNYWVDLICCCFRGDSQPNQAYEEEINRIQNQSIQIFDQNFTSFIILLKNLKLQKKIQEYFGIVEKQDQIINSKSLKAQYKQFQKKLKTYALKNLKTQQALLKSQVYLYLFSMSFYSDSQSEKEKQSNILLKQYYLKKSIEILERQEQYQLLTAKYWLELAQQFLYQVKFRKSKYFTPQIQLKLKNNEKNISKNQNLKANKPLYSKQKKKSINANMSQTNQSSFQQKTQKSQSQKQQYIPNFELQEQFLTYEKLCEKCLQFYQTSLKIYQCYKYKQIQILTIMNQKAELYYHTNKLQMAQEILQSSEKYFNFQNLPDCYQVSHTYYLLSEIQAKKGDLTSANDRVQKALIIFQNSIMKQNTITYAAILKYSPINYSYQKQKLKIKIKISPQNSDLKQISILKKLYKQKYLPLGKNTQIVSEVYQIQSLYYKLKGQSQQFYNFSIKSVVNREKIFSKNQIGGGAMKNFDLYCEMVKYFLRVDMVRAQVLFQKIQQLYQQFHKPYKILYSKSSKSDNKIRQIQTFFYKYYLAKGLFLYETQRKNEGKIILQQSIELVLLFYGLDKNMQKISNSERNNKKYKVNTKQKQFLPFNMEIYQTQLKYIIALLLKNKILQVQDEIVQFVESIKEALRFQIQKKQQQEEDNKSNNSQNVSKNRMAESIQLIYVNLLNDSDNQKVRIVKWVQKQLKNKFVLAQKQNILEVNLRQKFAKYQKNLQELNDSKKKNKKVQKSSNNIQKTKNYKKDESKLQKSDANLLVFDNNFQQN